PAEMRCILFVKVSRSSANECPPADRLKSRFRVGIVMHKPRNNQSQDGRPPDLSCFFAGGTGINRMPPAEML
ncbi:MAG: hypothetical protein WBH50_23340, partial [Fuerstiella sp.]